MLVLAGMALDLGKAQAAGVDSTTTIVKPPEKKISCKALYSYPPRMPESAAMFGAIDLRGQNFVMIGWRPAFMSAPH
jgi:hypothetical protein